MKIFPIRKCLLKVNNKDTGTKTLDSYLPILSCLTFRKITILKVLKILPKSKKKFKVTNYDSTSGKYRENLDISRQKPRKKLMILLTFHCKLET